MDDLWELTEARNATFGISEIEKLETLNFILSGSNEKLFTPVTNRFAGASTLFLVARSFRDFFAAANDAHVSKVASDWEDSESWKNSDVNSFDLYCMVPDLNLLCAKACAEDKNLYLLLSS